MKNEWQKYLCISIELTDFCNSRCIFCDHHTGNFIHGRKAQFMKLELFSKIISDIEKLDPPPAVVSLSWLGESITHPQFIEILEIINASSYHNFHLNTNAISFTPKMADLILEKGKIRRLRFSLDAATPKTYRLIKAVPKANLNQTIANINYFLEKRGNNKYPQAVFSFVVCEENHQEALDFLLFWSKKLASYHRYYYVTHDFYLPPEDYGCDVIDFYMLLCPQQEKATRLYRKTIEKMGVYTYKEKDSPQLNQSYIVEDRFSEKIKANLTRRRPCASLWRMANIHSSGLLTICCHDLYLQETIGNLKEHSFSELWYGEKMEEKRKEHLRGEFRGLCEHCGNIEYFSVADRILLSYLEDKNYLEEKNIYFKRMGIQGEKDFDEGHN